MAVWTDQAAAPFPSPWHLDRLDAAGGVAALDGVFDTGQTGAGEGVHIYVLDTGLDEGHAEFAGRVGRGYTKFGPDPNAVVDVNGHGTHCAGIAAGARNGVAKRATVHGVQVLDAEGLGSFEVRRSPAPAGVKHGRPDVVTPAPAVSEILRRRTCWRGCCGCGTTASAPPWCRCRSRGPCRRR